MPREDCECCVMNDGFAIATVIKECGLCQTDII